jgi:branched-chain amino acid transport system permease protein
VTLFFQQVINGLVVGSTYAIVALGFGLVFSVMRVVNLAHPDIFMLAMFATFVVMTHLTHSVIIVVLLVVIFTAALGLVIEASVLRPLRRRRSDILMPMIATAGVSVLLENGTAGIFGTDPVSVPALMPYHQIRLGRLYLSSAQLINILLAVAILVAVSYYVRRTRWGRSTRAIAEKPEIASAFGVNVNRVSQLTVALASVMAGLAGLAIANLYSTTSPFIAGIYTLKAFICMLVAGNRHVEGIMVIGLSLGVGEALVATYLSSNYRDAVAFIALIVVLLIRPNGAFGSYEYEVST